MQDFILSFFIALITAAALSTLVLSVLSKTPYARENYRGVKVIAGSGLIIPINILIHLLLVQIIARPDLASSPISIQMVIFMLISLAILGAIDDLKGDRSTGGFKGHFGRLLKGELTTGSIKALGGGLVAIIAAYPSSSNLFELIIKALAIALFINLFNLLDLRPGRALKVFIILGVAIALMIPWRESLSIWGAVMATGLVLLHVDLSERGMLGDVGSNLLGGLTGYFIVTRASFSINLILLTLLVFINLYSEKRSISELIERVSFLRWLDELGRRV
ncbi:MAG: hypothetical protein QMD53_00235 [Actinomycetota bacterium]|nr:hypothetical protein [Actinomycetota bacterium]